MNVIQANWGKDGVLLERDGLEELILPVIELLDISYYFRGSVDDTNTGSGGVEVVFKEYKFLVIYIKFIMCVFVICPYVSFAS